MENRKRAISKTQLLSRKTNKGVSVEQRGKEHLGKKIKEGKGRKTMIRLFTANHCLSLARQINASLSRYFSMIQKSRSIPVKRVTEAEPTFASAWNRATRYSPRRGEKETAVILLSRNAQTTDRSVRAVVKETDSRTMRPFVSSLRMRITRIKNHECPSIILVADTLTRF